MATTSTTGRVGSTRHLAEMQGLDAGRTLGKPTPRGQCLSNNSPKRQHRPRT